MGSGHSYDMLKRSKQDKGLPARDSAFNRNGQYARLRRYRNFYKTRRMTARQMQQLMEAVYKRQVAQEQAFWFTVLLTIGLVAAVILGVYFYVY